MGNYLLRQVTLAFDRAIEQCLARLNAQAFSRGDVVNTQTLSRLQSSIEPLGIKTLIEIALFSFDEFRNKVRDVLSWHETRVMYRAAQRSLNESKLYEALLLSRSNPQLSQAVGLAIAPPRVQLHDYESMLGQRASQYVAPGSVASMFSPAAYLTEMYREARALHYANFPYHLDVRRPDLAALGLSQRNLDESVSTLDLSNEILQAAIRAHDTSLTGDESVPQRLATWRAQGATPFNEAFEQVRRALLTLDPEGKHEGTAPDVAGLMSAASRLGIRAGISPELHAILTEAVPDESADQEFERNFGNVSVNELLNVRALAQYYDISDDLCSEFIENYALKGYRQNRTNTLSRLAYPKMDQAGNLSLLHVTRFYASAESSFVHYIELIPARYSHNFELLRFSFASVPSTAAKLEVFTSVNATRWQSIFVDEQFNDGKSDQEYRLPINIEIPGDWQNIQVSLNCYDSSGRLLITPNAGFIPGRNLDKNVLLEINKSIRAHKATGLAPAAVDAVAASVHADWTMDEAAVRRMLEMQSSMQRNAIDYDRALCLCNGDISRLRFGGQSGQFDRLFNSPPLNGYVFGTGGPRIDLKPDSSGDDLRKAVLKRAFQVDDVALYRLLLVADPGNKDGTIPNDLAHLSALYRAHLLADVHRLSVDDLALLMAGLGEAATGLIGISDEALFGLLHRLRTAVRWLNDMKWNPYDLFVMTTTVYADTLTPDIGNLLEALNNGLPDADLNDGELIEAMAPYVAASLRLTSNEVACAVLLWLDQLQPNGMGVDAFWAAVANHAPPPAAAIQFCHALAQLALVYQATGLDANSFRRLVEQPDSLVTLPEGATVAGHDARTLMQLTAYAEWVGRLAGNAATVLSAFEVDTLTPTQLAQAMALDEQLLRQAGKQAAQHEQIEDSELLHTWPEIDVVMQWINLANGLGVAPKGVADWLALDYMRPADAAVLAYPEWERVATSFVAALPADQADTVAGTVAESLAATLAGYYLAEVADPTLNLRTRDDLYSYLLIDNQVSPQIKTTRIAEAMASIQLYVHRALSRSEPQVLTAVSSRQYFADWETYNKRYSTWAGVSQLVYYPENYIDPTLRIGQTGMMNNLLQSVNQAYLTADTVDDAFNIYLTAFEQVANLDVVSAYHDNVNVDQGLTYFVGSNRSSEAEFSWRSVDHNKCHDGQFAANAWSEWRAINCALKPYHGVIRPVVRNTRLYLVWLERTERAEAKAEGEDVINEVAYQYWLKLAYLRYDGTWSAPLTYEVSTTLAKLQLADDEAPGLYCAESPTHQSLLVLFYKIQGTANAARVAGLVIQQDLSSRDLTTEQSQYYRDNVHAQFDTPNRRRVNNRYGEHYQIPYSVTVNSGFEWGAHQISRVFGGKIAGITYESSLDKLYIKCAISLGVTFDVTKSVNNMAYMQLYTMQRQFQAGDRVILYNDSTQCYGPVGKYGTSTFVVSNHVDVGPSPDPLRPYRAIQIRYTGSSINASRITYNGIGIYSFGNVPADLANSIQVQFDDYGHYVTYSYAGIQPSADLNTKIPPDKVVISCVAGGGSQHFSADAHVENLPPPSLYAMNFSFEKLTVDASRLIYVDNRASVDITCEAKFADGQLAGKEFFSIPVVRIVEGTSNVLSLHRDNNGAQYMQWEGYRVRLNTLFARQLIELAAVGLDRIMTLDTQYLAEPPLGEGGYVNVTLPAYNPTVHGSTRGVRLVLQSGAALAPAEFAFLNASLTDIAQHHMLFVPVSQVRAGDALDFPADLSTGLGVVLACQRGQFKAGQLRFDPATLKPTDFVKDSGWTSGRDADVQIDPIYIEPMDFGGANALYFWELFYYTPMLVAQRLLVEQRFDEAQRWLQYVWNPAGYVVEGLLQDYQWNVRPLEEDLGWNAESLDSTDPDAIAQVDPMHYKVATFMRWLDLLLARGDRAYRQLERDTLSEAKMWYVQALQLLGEQPYLPRAAEWSEPSLAAAADETAQLARLQALEALSAGGQPAPLTANSLTALFLPQANDVLQGYWRTLEQRLYNLRHNLSIDGQPLSLAPYATPANPKALQSAAVSASSGGKPLPPSYLTLWRFPQMLENAKSTVSQLMQFGSNLQGIIERQDAEALSELLQNQAKDLVLISLSEQDQRLAEVDSSILALTEAMEAATQRRNHYTKLYDENINSGEQAVLGLRASSSAITATATALQMAGALAEMVPNIFGFSIGGSRWGAALNASAFGAQVSAAVTMITADQLSQSEMYRRRREEWDIQAKNAQADVDQIKAQQTTLRHQWEAAMLQRDYLQRQQEQTEAQLEFLKIKSSSKALYSWMRGRLLAIYSQFSDLAVARCVMAEQAFQWETHKVDSFIKRGAWQDAYYGLLCGEELMRNLAEMEAAYLIQDARALEVVRTVSLADFYAGLPDDKQFDLAEKVVTFIEEKGGRAGSDANSLLLENGRLSATVTLRDLKLVDDYPANMQLGSLRRIKQLSVSLPALIGPYQDIQAVLSYGGSIVLPRGCEALAVSRGLDDSGQFELNFNDGRFLPFEGIPVDDVGTLTLAFPNALGKQEAMLRTLNDIVLHIRYTILR
ncbi:Tc toxin subunit A-related protein [Burkholderia pseudomallei]|uniref:Tc toxin subunit A-related protein n=1 Tax=Burkholderia pseudomallei TaxID=28450 RepID=UPI002116D542|nr:neuraminidase-like domain-containing protein [Burkholderia pseudomallei]